MISDGEVHGDGHALVATPVASGRQRLVRDRVRAVDVDQTRRVTRAGGVAHDQVRRGRVEVDVEVEPLAVGVPARDVAPAGEAGVARLEAEPVQHAVFGLVVRVVRGRARVRAERRGVALERHRRGAVGVDDRGVDARAGPVRREQPRVRNSLPAEVGGPPTMG